MPFVKRWEYDDNAGERSFEIFHVHVFIEVEPYSYEPDDNSIYKPLHPL
jgi:hypothetical protein